jgi:hypothetical protein
VLIQARIRIRPASPRITKRPIVALITRITKKRRENFVMRAERERTSAWTRTHLRSHLDSAYREITGKQSHVSIFVSFIYQIAIALNVIALD